MRKGGVPAYREFTYDSAHEWNLIILCTIITKDITVVYKVHIPIHLFPLLK